MTKLKDDIKIREANLADLEEIAEVAFCTWKDAYQGIVPGK